MTSFLNPPAADDASQFQPGDRVAYRNPGVSSAYNSDVYGTVVKVTSARVKVRLTNQLGRVAIKDVRPEYLRKLEE
jgi:hypothetical protein